MLKIEVDGSETRVDFRGGLVEICSGLGGTINKIYRAFGQRDPDVAEAFRAGMTALFTDPESPLWTEKNNGYGVTIVNVTESEE